VKLSVISATHIGQISVKFSIGRFIKICLETPAVVKMGQKYWA